MPSRPIVRYSLAVMLAALLAAAAGCAPTQPTAATSTAPPTVAAASPVITPPAERKLVAIAGFENRSTYAADKLWDTCSSLLSSQLIQMGYFRVVEWERMKRLFNWEELSTGSLVESPARLDKARKILMCEYFISGAVTHFDVSQQASVSAISKRKTLVTAVRVDLTLQDARTGEYVSAGSGEGVVRQAFTGGMSGGQLGTWDPKAADEAITMAIEKALIELTLQADRLAAPTPATTVAGTPPADRRCPDGVCTVTADGVAGIPGGYVERARLVALRSAYAEAVSQVAGVQIGSLTVMKNFQLLSDLVTSRTRGFIKSYRVIDEGVAQQQDHYFVKIQADVLESGAASESDTAGLQLYVALLEHPTVLILLEEERFGGPVKENPHSGALQRSEAAMARVFSDMGYQVVTSDDLVGRPLSQTDQGNGGGATGAVQSPALRAARAVGADVVIAGTVSTAERPIEPAKGVAMVMVSAELRAKAVLAASGKVARVFQFSDRASHRDALVAHVDCLTKLAQTFSNKTAWEIPQLLAQEERQTLLIIENTGAEQVQRIQTALAQSDDIEAVRLTKLPTAASPEAVLRLKTGYIQLAPQEVLAICRERIQRNIELIEADKFQMRISL